MPAFKSQALMILALGMLLAGCSTNGRIPQCPSAAILSDTATVTGFRAGAPADPSGEAFTAAMTDVRTHCTFVKATGLTTSGMDITVRATRAPGADGATYTLPYYVAVTQGDRILSKKNFTLQITFPPGSAQTSLQDSIDETVIQLEAGHPPTDYQLLVGFQLTEAQRAYNKIRGRYLP